MAHDKNTWSFFKFLSYTSIEGPLILQIGRLGVEATKLARQHRKSGGIAKMFSPQVLKHVIEKPYSAPLADATHEGLYGWPGDGPYVHLWLRILNNRIVDARFETHGCPAVVASVGELIDLAKEMTVDGARSIDAETIRRRLGGLPEGKGNCADMAIDAFRSAIENEVN